MKGISLEYAHSSHVEVRFDRSFHYSSSFSSHTELNLDADMLAEFTPEQLDALFPSGVFGGVDVRAVAAIEREKAVARKKVKNLELARRRGIRLLESARKDQP